MAVRIRLKKMGRAHRPFYRVCAFDHHAPRDGRALEELGTYDTSLDNTDARAVLDAERIDYWLSVGAQPTPKVAVLIKKYGKEGTHLDQQKVALEELSAPKSIPAPGAPASLPKQPEPEQPEPEKAAESKEAPAESAPAESATTDSATTAPDDEKTAVAPEAAAEAPAAEAPAAETPATETPATETPATGTPATGAAADAEEKAPQAAE